MSRHTPGPPIRFLARSGRSAVILVATALVVAACSGGGDSSADESSGSSDATSSSSSSGPSDISASASGSEPGATTTSVASLPAPAPASSAPPVTEPPPVCTWTVATGDSLGSIANQVGGFDAAALQDENELPNPNVINVGQVLDICPGNDFDDVRGESRVPVPPTVPPVEMALPTGVEAQQRRVNEMLVPYGMRELQIDGVAGPATRQRLCAVRLLLGMPTSVDLMVPGSDEERSMMAAEITKPPVTAARNANRWALIDRTCQVMVIGSGSDEIVYVFPTSTGSEGFETRLQDGVRAFRYNPAIENNGWHDSSEYAVPEDNPLNGNMYKPIYFDDGQAIHGAPNVPPEPRSKGCARLRVDDQDKLIAWLNLDDELFGVWSAVKINLSVSVQGDWVPPANA